MVLLAAASAGAVDSLSLAVAEMEEGRYQDAATSLRQGVSDGDQRCAFVLGMLTLEGKGTERDPTLASELLGEAADAGLPAAQSTLGLLYASGDGVEKDLVAAAKWYRKAAEFGDPMGQAALGAALFLGVGVPMDQVKGYMWTKLAAAQEYEGARSNLAAMESELTNAQQRKARIMAGTFEPRPMPVAGRSDMDRTIYIFQRDIKDKLRGCAHKSECWY